MMNNRNLGSFRITAFMIEKNPEVIAEVFSRLKIVPLKVEYRPDVQAFEYLAIGEKFEELKKFEVALAYEFVIKKNESGNIESVEAVKIVIPF